MPKTVNIPSSWLNKLFGSDRTKLYLFFSAYLVALIVMSILLSQRWTIGDILIATLMFPLGLAIYLAPALGWFWSIFPEDGKTIMAALTGYLIYVGLAVAFIRSKRQRVAGVLYIIIVILLIVNVSSCVSGMNTY